MLFYACDRLFLRKWLTLHLNWKWQYPSFFPVRLPFSPRQKWNNAPFVWVRRRNWKCKNKCLLNSLGSSCAHIFMLLLFFFVCFWLVYTIKKTAKVYTNNGKKRLEMLIFIRSTQQGGIGSSSQVSFESKISRRYDKYSDWNILTYFNQFYNLERI